MAAVTVCSDFGAQEEEICHYFHLFLFYLPYSNVAGCHDLSFFFFFIFSLKLSLSLSFFNLIDKPFSSSLLSAIRVSSAYLRLLMFLSLSWLQLVTHPAQHISWCAVYRLNKQGDSRQPCCTPFLILNQSVVPYRILTVAFWPVYRFLKRQARWSGILTTLRVGESSTVCHDLQSKALA